MTAPASGEASPVQAWCGVCDAPAEGCGCASLKTSSPVQEASPVEAAARVLFLDYEDEHDPGTVTPEEFEPLARAAAEALLAGDWLERVLGEHADFTYVNDGIDGGHFRCDCGHEFGYEDGAHAEWEAHLAAAVRIAAGVGL